jgi:hypothetical protein
MSQSVSVLLLDDGELDDVQAMLESMRIPFGRVRGASIVPGMPGPTDLLIATPRRIEAVQEINAQVAEEAAPVRIVVANEDSNALRDRLRRVGFDFIIRRPVHPEAMRLLILHALFTGEEQRSEPRIPMGIEVGFKTGVRQRRATLVDLSTRGCRLLTSVALEPAKRLRIQLPEELGSAEPLTLRGHVIRVLPARAPGSDRLYTVAVAVAFDKLSMQARSELERILEERANEPPQAAGSAAAENAGLEAPPTRKRGIVEIPARNLQADPRFEPESPGPAKPRPATKRFAEAAKLRPPDTPNQTAAATEPPLASSPPEADSLEERRKHRRAAFAAKVPAFGSRALRVLVGRDLSVQGMRVEASPDVELGDRLHLAIYGNPDDEPFLVWATVARDDGDAGMGVVFDEVHPVVARQLEALVASLPAVESLHDDETEAMGTVVSEILPGGGA